MKRELGGSSIVVVVVISLAKKKEKANQKCTQTFRLLSAAGLNLARREIGGDDFIPRYKS